MTAIFVTNDTTIVCIAIANKMESTHRYECIYVCIYCSVDLNFVFFPSPSQSAAHGRSEDYESFARVDDLLPEGTNPQEVEGN